VTFWQFKAVAPRLRAIPLERVLPLCGAQPDRADRRKWHTPAGVLSVTGAKFMNWNLGVGGGGAIDLVIHLHHLDFKAAVTWLADHFPGALPPGPVAPPPPAVPLRLPPPAPGQLARVRDYLVGPRGLPLTLVEPLLAAGTLYADARANAVFLLRDEQNVPVGAELRGTTACSWHGLAPGSQKDQGYFSIPIHPPQYCYGGRAEPLPAVVLCESAIDAISCLAFHPRHRCLSTAGARPNPHWLQRLLDRGCEIYCGFDADPIGDQMARAMMALHTAVKRLRPERHDWNDVLRARA
jgi:hypothetical protein